MVPMANPSNPLHVGLMVPSNNTTMERELKAWLPAGSTCATQRIPRGKGMPGAIRRAEEIVAANPGALATLFQQGQIDISPGNFNAIQILKARGVPVEFVAPKEGAIAFKTTIHIVKNEIGRAHV